MKKRLFIFKVILALGVLLICISVIEYCKLGTILPYTECGEYVFWDNQDQNATLPWIIGRWDTAGLQILFAVLGIIVVAIGVWGIVKSRTKSQAPIL